MSNRILDRLRSRITGRPHIECVLIPHDPHKAVDVRTLSLINPQAISRQNVLEEMSRHANE